MDSPTTPELSDTLNQMNLHEDMLTYNMNIDLEDYPKGGEKA